MAKRKVAAEREPDMHREPQEYFDVTFTGEEYDMLRDRIIEVSGVAHDRWFWDLEEPTKHELFSKLVSWGRCKSIYECVIIKLARDLGIDHRTFAKNVPKLPIDSFVDLATKTFTDFVPARNSTISKLQVNRLQDLFNDWLNIECPRKRGCKKSEHAWCHDHFVEPMMHTIMTDVAAANQKRRRRVSKDIAHPTVASASRLRLVYSSE
jgi:hypothetical protein